LEFSPELAALRVTLVETICGLVTCPGAEGEGE